MQGYPGYYNPQAGYPPQQVGYGGVPPMGQPQPGYTQVTQQTTTYNQPGYPPQQVGYGAPPVGYGAPIGGMAPVGYGVQPGAVVYPQQPVGVYVQPTVGYVQPGVTQTTVYGSKRGGYGYGSSSSSSSS